MSSVCAQMGASTVLPPAWPSPTDWMLIPLAKTSSSSNPSQKKSCATGNLWVADFHRPETKRGRLTVLSPAGKLLGTLNSPARSLTNLTFGGPKLDELFCTTDTPNGVMHAKVGIRGFPGHLDRPMKVQRVVNE